MPASSTHSQRAPANLHDALLAASHAKNSIYESSRMSGENRHRHHVLPIDDRSEHCSDSDDALYARSLASLVATSKASRL